MHRRFAPVARSSAAKLGLVGLVVVALSTSALPASAAGAPSAITVCASGCEHTSIQDAIDAASDGDTVTVEAGNYSGELVITKADLTLQGAQAGVDARSRSGDESVITAGRIQLSASNITVKGFTLTGATHGADSSAAIWGTGIEGTQILDNIIEDSFMGVQFTNSGGSTMAVVRHNVFSNNNVGTNSGSGVFMLGSSSESSNTNISIVDNTFSGHVNAAINVNGHNATISGNTSSGDSTFAVIANSSNITITDNVATGDPGGHGILLGRGNDGVTISGNTLNSVATNNTSAVRVSADFGTVLSKNYTIHNNIVTGSWRYAIRVSDDAYSGEVVDAQNNAFSSRILNSDPAVSVDATRNWWGSAEPDFETVVSGNVSYDPWFTSSAMNVLSSSVSTTSTVTVSPSGSAVTGDPVTVTGTVSPSTAVGTIEILDGTTRLDEGTATDGVFTVDTSALAVGSHSLTATFTPANVENFQASTSAAVAFSVNAPSVSTTSTVSVLPSGSALAGAAVTVTGTVSPSAAVGSIAILDGTTRLGGGAVAGGVFTVDTSALVVGSHSLTAKFTPANAENYQASSSAAIAFSVNEQELPAELPWANTDQLEVDIELAGLDVSGTTDSFVPSGDTTDNPLDSLDVSKTFSGTLPWSDGVDSFVDVYAYSHHPAFLGTFPVVGGLVQITGVDLSALEEGGHHLVFVGQTSGTVSVMAVTVKLPPDAAAAVPAGSVSLLSSTGADPAVPIGAAGILLLLGLGLLIVAARRRRRA